MVALLPQPEAKYVLGTHVALRTRRIAYTGMGLTSILNLFHHTALCICLKRSVSKYVRKVNDFLRTLKSN